MWTVAFKVTLFYNNNKENKTFISKHSARHSLKKIDIKSKKKKSLEETKGVGVNTSAD